MCVCVCVCVQLAVSVIKCEGGRERSELQIHLSSASQTDMASTCEDGWQLVVQSRT